MNPEFWHQRWERGEIGWHREEVNPNLREHWPKLAVRPGTQVFVPLCGKTRDLLWLAGEGYDVLGVEISPEAVRMFFEENRLKPHVVDAGPFRRWQVDELVVLEGDFYDLTTKELEFVGAVYDRASLIALPAAMRARYAERMADLIMPGVPTLLIVVDYPAGEIDGPPFPMGDAEVRDLYAEAFDIALLATQDALADNPHLRERGLSALTERVYTLRRR